MSSDLHRRQAFDLEGLEPRLLLSANGISGVAPAQIGNADPLQTATVVSMFTDSIATNSGGQASENDLFDGVADEALAGPKTTPIASSSLAENAASEAPVSATETASAEASDVTNLMAATLATDLGSTSLRGQSDALSDQLTTTLKAANGPPAGGETLSAEEIIPLPSDFSSQNSQPRVAAAAFVPSDSSENTPTRSAASTDYAGSHTFSGTTTINIAGKNAGEFDVITVSGTATLGDTLAITVSGNPSLQVGDTLTIITAGTSVTGAFANATGLFGFGDGSRYFAVVQDAGSVKLVVKEFPGSGLSFVADTTAGADALGRFLNNSYFTSNQAVTVAGGLSITSGVSVRGTFTFAQSSLSSVDIATGLGKPLSQFTDAELSAGLKSQLTSLGISSDGAYLNDIGMSVIRISASGAEGFVGETVNLGSAFGSQIRTGFLVKNMNLGIAVMTPTWSVAPTFPATSFVSAKATGAVEAIGFGGLMDFTAPSATIEVNTGTSFTSAANNAVIDFAKSFETTPGAANGSYTVGTTQLAFGGQTKVLVNLTNVSVTLLDVLDLRGDFAFEIGPQKTVSVQTNVPAKLAALPGFYETTLQQFVTAGLTVTGSNTGLAGLVVNTYRFSATNVSGFIGLGDPTFNATTRAITNGSDLVGFGFANLNLDIGLFGVESLAITKLGMPDFVALKGQVSSVDSYGMDGVLEMNAQGVTIAINTAAKFKGGIPLGTLDLPDFTLPTIELPNLLLPDLSLPTITLPQISLPSISLPDFNIPSLSLPSLSLPSLQIPTITLPSIDLPSIDLSNLIPTITLPNLTLPSITLPDLSLPTIDLSALRAYLPNPSLPNLTLPSLTLPDLVIPAIHLPDLIPTLDLSGLVPRIVFPTITFPTIQLPSINLPDLDLSAFGLPNLRLPALTLPSFTLPSITLPSIDLPNLDIHLPGLPNFQIPAISLPDISLPSIHLPNLSLPNLDLSALHLFDLIFPDLSGIHLPSLTLPQITLPALSFPSLKFPNIDLSGINLPNVSIPSFTLPNFALPTVNLPSLQLPNLYVPEFDLLRFRLPNLTLPTLTLPSISLPTLMLPDFDITFPEMPTLRLPDLHLPSLSLPSLQLPSLNLPDIDLSLLHLPGIPRITLPTINLPSISLPSIQLPDLHLPSLKLPDINVPSLADLPGIKLNKIGAPAIDFQASFGSSGLPVGGSALDFNGARRTTVSVARIDIQLASALSLTGSIAFEFGPRYLVNVATGLPANLGTAANLVQPFFNYLSSQAGLTIGQNFSTISGLEVESMTVGASNLTAFLGYGNPDLHSDLSTQEITGFGISDVTFGLGIFKPTLPIKKLPSFTVLKATAGSFSTYGMDGVFDLQGTGLTIEINTGTAWPARLGTPVIDFTSSFPSSGSTPVGFAVTMPAGTDPVYLDYDGEPRIAFGVQSATVNLAEFIVLKGGIRVVMGPTYIVNIDTGIPADLGVALGAIGLDSIANQLTSIGGVTIGPNFSTISGLEVRSMTIAGSNMSAWVGSTNYDFNQPLANQDVYGFKLQGLTFGLGIFTPNLPIEKLPKFTALTAHTDSFEFKSGASNPFSLTGSDLTINLNTGTKWPGGIGTPVLDFTTSFETTPGAANGQFAVSTTTGVPIYLKFDGNERIGVSVGKATLQISEFVYVTGAFNFEKGPKLNVPLIAGVAGSQASGLVPAQFGGTGYKEVSTMVVGGSGVHAFVGLDGPYWVDANHNGLIDRDANGNIVAAETNARAVGLVIDNLDFGLFIGIPTNLIDPVRYIGLKATANTVKLVGISGVTASANGISIDLNISTPTVGILPVLPVIDFSGLAGGKFTINTGGKNSSGEDISIDLAMKSALIRAQGFIALNVFNSVYLTGSVAFELGPTKTVNLVGGGTKTVSTMSIGVAHVNAFVGANGPYWVDSNRDKTVQNGELSSTAMGFSIADFTGGLLVMASTNPSDLGAYVALKATVSSFGLVNMPAGISATGILDLDINVGLGLSGIDPSIAAVDLTTSFGEAPALFALIDANHDNRLDQAEQTAALAAGYIGQNITSISQLVSILNASTGPPDEYLTISEVGAKLKASFKTSHQAAIDDLDADGNGRLNFGFEVSTGDPTTPVVLDSDKFLISIQLAGQIRQTGVFRLNGAFLFEVDSSALKAFVAAGLEVGPDIGAATGSKIFTMNALGALVITGSGLAADLEVSASVGGALRNVLALNATARVVMNTTGADQFITIPKRYAGYITGADSIVGVLPGSTTFDPSQAAALAGKLTGRFTTNADGSLRFTIDRRAPRLGGGFDAAGPYFMVALHGNLTIARTFVIRADFQLKVSAQGLQLGYNGLLDLGGYATVNVAGGAVIENGVFATFARLSIDITVSGIRISGSADFEINSGSAAKTAYDALGQARTIAGTTYMVTVNANINLFNTLTATGTVKIGITNGNFLISVNATLNFFGFLNVGISGYINTNGTFSFTGSMGLDLTAGGFGIRGSLSVTLNNSGVAGSGSVSLVVAGQNINLASGAVSVNWNTGAWLIRAEGPLSVWLEVSSNGSGGYRIDGGLGFFDDVLEVLEDVADAIAEGAVAAANAIADAAIALGGAIVQFGQDVVNFFEDVGDAIANAAEAVWDAISGFFEDERNVITEYTVNPRDYYLYSASLVAGTLTINNGTGYGSASQLNIWVVDGNLVVDAPDYTRTVAVSSSQHQERDYEWDGWPPWGEWSDWYNVGSPTIQYANITVTNASAFALGSVSKIVIVGTNASETIVVDRNTVSIDTDVYANGGNDVIATGRGNDRVWGGDGDDVIFTYEGNDQLYGENGNDKLFGGVGNDYYEGGAGNDVLDENKDRLNPGTLLSETNTMWGGSGNDTILGSPGRDTIIGGSGDDILLGLSHDDIYVFTDGYGTDKFVDFTGKETLDFSGATNALTVTTPASGWSIKASGGDLSVDFQTWLDLLKLGSGSDTATLSKLPNRLLNITDAGGRDLLTVDDSADTANNAGVLTGTRITGLGMGNADQSVVDASQGIAYSGIEDLVISLGSGNDTFTINSTTSGTSNTTILNTGSGTDIIHLNGASNTLTVNGQNDVDTINVNGTGVGSAVTLNGGSGSDVINFNNTGGTTTANGESGADIFNVNGTGAGSTTTLNGGDGADIYNVKAIAGATTINGGNDDDTINVGTNAAGTAANPTNNSGGTVDNIGATLTINGDAGGNDVLNVDDSGDGNGNVGTLTLNRITGLDMAGSIIYQTIEALNIALGTGGDTFNVQSTTAIALTTLSTGSGAAANTVNLGSLAPSTGGNLNSILGKLTVNGQSSSDIINVDDTGDGSANTGTLTATRLTGLGMGDDTKGLQYAGVETLNINAGTGGDTLNIQGTSAVTVTTVNTGTGTAANIVNLGSVAPATPGNVNAIAGKLNVVGQSSNDTINVDDTADTAGNVGTLTGNRLTGLGMGADDPALGLQYTTIETFNLQLGQGGDVINIRGTTAVTNTYGNGGDDRVYVSSGAGETLSTATDFLRGNLDQILGTLNLDLGTGTHVLMISDEGSTVGKGTTATPVRITDQPVVGAGIASSEITITDLTAAPGITYKAAPTGTFGGGVTIWLGSGNDVVSIDGTHNRGNGSIGSVRTATTLNTGAGNDTVIAILNSADGFFALNTQDGDDVVDASTSTRPLVIFGGAGKDTIAGGSTNDIIFGDHGLVTYYNGVNIAAVFGNGGTGDRTDGIERPLGYVTTTFPTIGDNDVISGGAGSDLVLGGAGDDSLDASATDTANDIVVGDNGEALFTNGFITQVSTTSTHIGGNDTITTGKGTTIAFGGVGSDTITAGVGSSILVGDNGTAKFDPANGRLLEILSTAPGDAGPDVISTGDGDNVIIGGSFSDLITTGNGNDIIVGDNGHAFFDPATYRVTSITTTAPDQATGPGRLVGGVTYDDVIDARTGNNIVFGGSGADFISTQAGDDILVGDNGNAIFDSSGVLRLIQTTDVAFGGDDRIVAGTGADVVLGGSGADDLDAGSEASGDISRDVLVGDNGRAEFDSAANLTLIFTTAPGVGGNDTMLLGGGNNVAFGGVGSDTITGGTGNDIIVGDNGSAAFDATTHLAIDVHTTDATNAAPDTIVAGEGDNIVLGGTGNDSIVTGAGSDVIVGDNGIATFYPTGIIKSIETIDAGSGGDDFINAGNGTDVVFGGSGNDFIDSGSIAAGDVSRDIAVGDNGHADFDSAGNLTLVYTTFPAIGGDDTILIGGGDNVAFGGVGNDEITAGDGRDIIAGDNGSALFDSVTHALIDMHTTDAANAGVDLINAANGDNVIFGGTANDILNAGDGADVVVGDNGIATFYADGVLRSIETSDPIYGGDDIINTGTGADVVFGGSGKDTIDSGSIASGDVSRDVVVGDNGHADFDAAGNLASIYTTVPAIGDNDTILIGGGDNVAFGGVGSDEITAGDGDDIIVGDNGAATFDATTHAVVDVHTTDPAQAGPDLINAGNGNNVILAGSANDTVDTGTGADIVVGDNGRALFDPTAVLRVIETIDPTFTGDDLINTGTGPDVVLGGSGSDYIDSGSVAAGDDSRDVVVGDNGRAEFDAAGYLTFVTTTDPAIGGSDTILIGAGDNVALGGVADDSITAGDGSDTIVGDNGAATFHAVTHTLANIHTSDPLQGGVDTILAGNGNNVVLGGSSGDTITTGSGDDIVLGDNGYADYVVADGNPADLDVIASTDFDIGGIDTINTDAGSDIVIGGQAADVIDAGTENNIVFGDNARIVAAAADAPNFSTQPFTLGLLETLAPGIGGADQIRTGVGRDIIFGGTGADTIIANTGEDATTSDGDNIVLGDDGYIDFVRGEREPSALGGDSNPADIDVIASSDYADGAADIITTGNGSDIVIGGQGGDTILAGNGSNLVIGDSGIVTAATEDLNRYSTQPITVGRVETTAFGVGGSDGITTGSGNDIVLGGHDNDTINAGEGDNLVAGDDAAIDYVRAERAGATPGADLNAADIDHVTSLSTTAAGGADTINTGSGNDIVIGGRFGDAITAGAGNNLVIGDSGAITAANEDTNRFSTLLFTVGLIESIAFHDGGADTITTLDGNDVVLGGNAGDTINAGEGANVVIGDDAVIDYVRAERGGPVPGADFNAGDIDLITSLSTTANGGADDITTGTGNDLIVGGRANDTIRAGEGNNLVIGDSGQITAANDDANRFSAAAPTALTVGLIETTAFGDGGVDSITTGAGSDVILGGHAADVIDAGNGDNLVVGDDALIDYVRLDRSPATPGADASASDIDYITSTSIGPAGGADRITTGTGNDLIIGGRYGDTINAGPGNNFVFGDSARLTAADSDAARFGSAPLALITLGRVETIQPGDGGDDTITTGIGRDTIFGGTGSDIIVGNNGESAATPDADNIVFGDDGFIEYTRADREPTALGADTDPSDIDLLSSLDFSDGGNDTITTGNGNDIVVAGQADDRVTANQGSNIVIGDSGIITAATEDTNRFATQPITLGRIETTAFGVGGVDNLSTGDGNDIVLGGDKGDVINASHGDNLVVGDDAAIEFTRQERDGAVVGADSNASDVDYVTSLSTTAAGGADTINTGSGNDIVIGGRFGDSITAGAGNNLVIGDSGAITAATEDINRFSTLLFTIGLIESITFHDGGADTITTLGGNDVVLGGNGGDTINAGEGANVVIGDDAAIDYVRFERDGPVPGADTDAGDIDLITSLSTTANGGADDITTGAGNDLIIGGRANDTIRAGEGNNLVIGDSGQVTAANDNTNRFSTQPATALTVGLIETITFGDGGADVITTGAGIDVILGGHESDTINAGNGDNLVFGDDGLIDYVRGERGSTAPGADLNAGDIDYLTSTSTSAAGGSDTITTGAGNDIVVGGRFGDTISADSGNNIVVGDSATITAANEDVNRFSNLAITVGRIETIEPTDGGADTITTLGGNDIILGGDAGDTINAGNGNNVVVGDDAAIDFTRVERDGAGPGADTSAGDIDYILSLSTTAGGGADSITAGSGNDLIIGGRFSDTINAGDGNNLAIGDSGRVTSANDNGNRFSDTAATTLTVGLVETIAFGDGGADIITTGNGTDVILGGHDSDTIFAGNGDNLVFGDDGLIDYVRGDRGSTAPGADTNAGDIDYLTSTSTTAAGGVDNITTGTGNDIVIGGRFGDTIAAGSGRNDVIGDSGFIIAATEDANRFSGLAITVGRIETMEFGDGGADTITTLEGNDVILGGHLNDTVNAGDGDNVVLGDDGAVEYVRRERDGVTSGADTNAADIDYITSLSTTAAGGADQITTGSGNDIIIGGRFADLINAGNGNNIALGDSAAITAVDEDAPRFGTQSITVGRVETIATNDGGNDEIRTGTGQDIVVGGAAADRLDSGAGDDLVIGDNEILDRTGRVGNFTHLLFEALTGTLIYDNFGNLLVNDLPANRPGGAPVWGDLTLTLTEHSLAVQTSGANSFGNDYIAGGAGNDRIFGGLGDDVIQGDGSIDLAVSARRLADGTLQVNGSVEAATDGDDYIEGNGGNDLIFGGLGQDDIIGGSSNFFGLTTPAMRPDASDLIFGGAGTDLAREDTGDTSTNGRARDADTILGDNGIIIRLVGTNNVAGAGYLGFNYDTYGALKIIARGVEFLDYTPGGIDLSPNAANDIGAADEIHGESGNDTIYAQLGDDVVFGEAQDDDIVGGTGSDWIAAGNGEDGVLGDDGRLYTSRNGTAEPLYGIGANPEGGLNLEISTPGNMQLATINTAGSLKKTAILEPFMLTNSETVTGRTPSNDIIFGGLGNDSLHGGAGDDAISGAEALPGYYAKPVNPGNILGFGLVRAGEFAAYDEYNPRTKIYVNPTTFEFVDATAPGAIEFILNFVATEQDGQDVIFGDVGNDWLVGGMGRDHIYGGYGDDLLNADDNHETNGGLNTAPDGPDSNQEDLAFGGAGRDVLIANTGGDRLIDWAGEFNSYIVPFANFGAATVSRTLNPKLAEFLYDLSASDGADPTRAQKTGSAVARNGEPEGELGLVRQQDFDWGDQTGAPADPQPGNIPGGKRDVIRSADFNNGTADDFSPDVGTWEVINGAYQVTPSVIGGDAVSLFNTMNVTLPRYFEIQATVTAVKPTGGYKGNGYIIFDYQSPTDFKFAGVNVSTNKLEIGHRTAAGWVVDATRNMQLKDNTGYNLLLSINGLTAVLVIDNSSTNVLTFTFGARVVDGYTFTLNSGLVGIGGAGARARIDNVQVQVLPPTITFTNSENFTDARANLLVGAQIGGWTVSTSGAAGSLGSGLDYAAYNSNLGLGASSVLMFDTTVRAGANGTSAGVVFDYYDSSNFKFAAIVAGTNQLVIGHHTKSGWSIDATVTVSQTLAAGTSYTLALTLKGTTVSVLLNPSTTPSGQQVSLAAGGFVYNAVITDGQAGLFSRGGASTFSSYLVKTDDPRLLGAIFSSTGSSSTTAGDAPRRQEG